MHLTVPDRLLKTKARRPVAAETAEKKREEGAVYLLRDQITLKKGTLAQFTADAEEFLDDLQRNRGWRLIAAGVSLTGRLNIVTHIWQIPDPDSLPETMHWLNDNMQYAKIQDHIESEEQEILLALIYDPKEPELDLSEDE